jgi:hypothetical protein
VVPLAEDDCPDLLGHHHRPVDSIHQLDRIKGYGAVDYEATVDSPVLGRRCDASYTPTRMSRPVSSKISTLRSVSASLSLSMSVTGTFWRINEDVRVFVFVSCEQHLNDGIRTAPFC